MRFLDRIEHQPPDPGPVARFDQPRVPGKAECVHRDLRMLEGPHQLSRLGADRFVTKRRPRPATGDNSDVIGHVGERLRSRGIAQSPLELLYHG